MINPPRKDSCGSLHESLALGKGLDQDKRAFVSFEVYEETTEVYVPALRHCAHTDNFVLVLFFIYLKSKLFAKFWDQKYCNRFRTFL